MNEKNDQIRYSIENIKNGSILILNTKDDGGKEDTMWSCSNFLVLPVPLFASRDSLGTLFTSSSYPFVYIQSNQ